MRKTTYAHFRENPTIRDQGNELMKILHLVLLFVAASSALAATNCPVRSLPPVGGFGAPRAFSMKELIQEAINHLEWQSHSLVRWELIGWSLKVDDLDSPPRLFEDAVVLIECATPTGSNEWALCYLQRMPAGSSGGKWGIPYYPRLSQPPIALSSKFNAPPTEVDLTKFFLESDFGNNNFDAHRTVLDVVIYHRSAALKDLLATGIPTEKKRERRNANERCFLERIEILPRR